MSGELTTLLAGEALSVEKRLMGLPQGVYPVTDYFAPGVYVRETIVPAFNLVVGHMHREETINIVLAGSALVKVGDELRTIKAPAIFNTPAGSRKIVYALEELRFLNVHPNPTNETDPDQLEDALIEKSEAFLKYEKLLNEMQTAKHINNGDAV